MNIKYFDVNDVVKIYLPFNIVLFGKIVEISQNDLVLITQEGNICNIPDTNSILAIFKLSSHSFIEESANNIDLSSLKYNSDSVEQQVNSKLKSFVKKRHISEMNKVQSTLKTPNFEPQTNYELPSSIIFKK